MSSIPREPWRLSELGDLERRDFLKALAAAAAGGALGATPLAAEALPGRPRVLRPQPQAPPPLPLAHWVWGEWAHPPRPGPGAAPAGWGAGTPLPLGEGKGVRVPGRRVDWTPALQFLRAGR